MSTKSSAAAPRAHSRISRRMLAWLLAMGCASALANPPDAQKTPVTRSGRVSLQGLDLSTAAGAQAARERIHQAARRLCGALADDLDLAHQPHFVACVAEATARATRRLDARNGVPAMATTAGMAAR
jgi:UrcA family protein